MLSKLNKIFMVIGIMLIFINLGYSQDQNSQAVNDYIPANESDFIPPPFFVFITHTSGCVGCCAASINYLSDQILKHYPNSNIKLIIYSSLKGEGLSKRKLFNRKINIIEALPDSFLMSKKIPLLLITYKNANILFEDLQSGIVTIDSVETVINYLKSNISISSIKQISEDSVIISKISSSTASSKEIYGIDNESNIIFKIANSKFYTVNVPHDTVIIKKVHNISSPDDVNVWGNLIKYYPTLVNYRNIIKIQDTIVIIANLLNGYTKYENPKGRPPSYVMKKSFYLLKIINDGVDLIEIPNDKILYGELKKMIFHKYYISQYSISKEDSICGYMVFNMENGDISYLCNYQNLINQKNNLTPLKQSYMLWSNDTTLFVDYSNKLFGSMYSNKLSRICDSTFNVFQKTDQFIDLISYRGKALFAYLKVQNNKYSMHFDEYNFKGDFIRSHEIRMPFTETILQIKTVQQEQNHSIIFLIKLEKSRWQLMELH